jgi:hypothetical protein
MSDLLQLPHCRPQVAKYEKIRLGNKPKLTPSEVGATVSGSAGKIEYVMM